MVSVWLHITVNGKRYMATTQLADGRSALDVQRQMGHRTLFMTNKNASLTTKHSQKSLRGIRLSGLIQVVLVGRLRLVIGTNSHEVYRALHCILYTFKPIYGLLFGSLGLLCPALLGFLFAGL